MNDTEWFLIDTETTGLSAPIFVVELAVQRMRGWEPSGKPLRRLLNQNADIPAEASRVHGYTREILERDGELPAEVYRELARYVRTSPIVAYNLDYDLEDVLKPEWRRLGIEPIGTKGFCALRLAQRLLDPVQAGNCKLQTLRQYYRLPERGAHTALGDVETVIDLLRDVLRPLAEQRGLTTWSDICSFTDEEWFPSRISFGKFKGRDFRDALTDDSLRGWLEWLRRSSNARSAAIGTWYLSQLNSPEPDVNIAVEADGCLDEQKPSTAAASCLVVYVHPELEQLRRLVSAARTRLAEIEAEYTRDRCAVDAIQAKLFHLLREEYQRRDRLRLLVDYRRRYLKVLLEVGEDDAAEVTAQYREARSRSDKNYDEAAKVVANRRELNEDEQMELKSLWKQLVRVYHPDRYAGRPDLKETYERLTATINKAKEEADIELLREIAADANAFILKQGWKQLDFTDEIEIHTLRKLYVSLQTQILEMLETLDQLTNSADFELHRLRLSNPRLLDEIAATRNKALVVEIAQLEMEAEKLKNEIAELTGQDTDL